MPNNVVQVPPDSTGKKVRTSEVVEVTGPQTGNTVEQQIVVIGDPSSPANQAAVTTLHTGFNQTIPTGGSMLQAGVAQVQNASGKLDPSLEGGQDGIPARGLPATITNLAQRIATTCNVNLVASTSPVTIAIASSAGFLVGGVAIIDTAASTVQEAQVVVSVPDTTHITVDHLNSTHSGAVTTFPVVMFVYNQERDAAGELDVAVGTGAATAIEYEHDGITYLRGRNVFGVGLYTDSVAASATASTNPVVLTVGTGPPANLQVGAPLIIDPLGANPEMQQITAINVGAKTITVFQLLNNHTGPFRVFAPVQNLSGAPTNVSGAGVAAEAAMLYSGLNGTTGVQQFSVEKDINAVGTVLPISVAVGAAGAAGIDADCELGVVDTTARTFATSTLIPDQHGQGGEDLVTVGGRVNFAITQANVQGGATVMKATAGRLCRLLVTTVTGGASLIITDGVGGTVIGIIPTATAIGTVFDLQMPAANSINIPQAGAWTGAVTASFY